MNDIFIWAPNIMSKMATTTISSWQSSRTQFGIGNHLALIACFASHKKGAELKVPIEARLPYMANFPDKNGRSHGRLTSLWRKTPSHWKFPGTRHGPVPTIVGA